MTIFWLYLISIPIFAGIDFIWLNYVAKSVYTAGIGHLMGPVNIPAAVAFYLIYLVGLTFFATMPAYTAGTLWYAVILGGLFSFFAYATYDLTNLATLKDWPLTLSLIDMAWGTFLGAAVSTLTIVVARLIL